MDLMLREEDAKDWVYKGEGAANLVLSYRGSSASLIGRVLRINKVPRVKTESAKGYPVLSKDEQLMWREFGELVESTSKELAGQVYVKRVMSPLLDPKHIDIGLRVNVCQGFLESVKNSVHTQRPALRIDAAEVDIRSDSALLISDHSVFRSNTVLSQLPLKNACFTVEIKPKSGFLPSSEFINPRYMIKKSITRFRMHQVLKLHEGEISQISGYDPLDLFSRSKDRVCQAITALYTTPENNFRIFLNGSLTFGCLGGGMDITAAHSHQANEKMDDFLKVTGLQLSSFIEIVAESLLKSAVLDKLLAAQKLDVLDIEGAIHLYYNIVSEPCIVCKDTSDIELLQKYSLLHSLSGEESLRIVREYLIAATAKDCSLMISFRPAESGAKATECDSIFLKSCNQNFDYKVNFIDLDMKPLKKMVHYYKLDQKIVGFYIKKFMTKERTSTSASRCAEGNG